MLGGIERCLIMDDTEAPSKFDKALAKETLVMGAMKRISDGESIELVAKSVRIPVGKLTEWIYCYRRHGIWGFIRRPRQPRPPLRTADAIAEALHREKMVIAALRLMADGLSQKQAAYNLDVPMATLHRWRHAYLDSGFTSLLPRGSGFGDKRRSHAAYAA